jgi:hypothetical protein
VLLDLAREIENLTESLKKDPYNSIGELDYRIEVLPMEQATKQQIILLQQVFSPEEQYKFFLKVPIGLSKSTHLDLIAGDPSQSLSVYPSPLLSVSQVDQAKQLLSQVYLDKFLKQQWNENLASLESSSGLHVKM